MTRSTADTEADYIHDLSGLRIPLWAAFFNRIGPLAMMGAGLYLLSAQAVANDSFLELISHGMGIYFIGRGIASWRSMNYTAMSTNFLAELVRRGR